MGPAALMAIGSGAKLLGGLFGKSGAQKQAEAQARAEQAAWNSKEAARVTRCQNITNWVRTYFAKKGVEPTSMPKAGTDNCPPPQPYAGATKVYGPSISDTIGAIGGGLAQYGASKYNEQNGGGNVYAGLNQAVSGTSGAGTAPSWNQGSPYPR